MTNAELLQQIDAAIEAILTRGQAYTINGRSYNRADLGVLWKMRKEAATAAERDAGGGRIRVEYGVHE